MALVDLAVDIRGERGVLKVTFQILVFGEQLPARTLANETTR